MKRITFDGLFCDIAMCKAAHEDCPHGICSQRQTWERLKLLEDVLGDNYDLDRLRELAEADREGRCVVLSTPMRPMICKPNDTDVYCPRCGETLSGGWPESDYYDYRKMVQCPNCGESIDDNKCESAEKEPEEMEGKPDG